MQSVSNDWRKAIFQDLSAGVVVFFVALPLCLGIALASDAPLISGILSGIVGGVIVGWLSGSHSSVSGPAAGLTAVVAEQIGAAKSFEAFLASVIVCGIAQIVLGMIRAGTLSAFVPTSVIKGLLAAIGVILILKQIPHLVGHDSDPEGEMSFAQPDHETTFSEFLRVLEDLHPGAAAIGIAALVLLIVWDRIAWLKKSPVPAPLVVVALGVAGQMAFRNWGQPWTIEETHLVQVPVASSAQELMSFLRFPDWSMLATPVTYTAGLTLALVASLETVLNLEAVDKLDPRKRVSNPNRELVAQGTGNLMCGLIGAIPVTSVIVRSSVNIHAGARTKLSAIFHGILLIICLVVIPTYVNQIPLSCLAAILLVTGWKLASPKLFRQMWDAGRYQFLPFVITLMVIVVTDLLVGIIVGLIISMGFVLVSNLRRPLRCIVERHLGGEVMRIELANQVSFLSRGVLVKTLDHAPPGSHLLFDATNTDFIDPDILTLIREFKDEAAKARNIQVSLRGFRERYQLRDEIQFVDYATHELQDQMTPEQVVQILRDGNQRFRDGKRLLRDLGRQVAATAAGQHPLAVVLSCIDSRTPAEYIFDLGLGDIFSVRIAGNVVSPNVLGSMEYGCLVAGAKVILVVGHTRCGAVTASVQFAHDPASVDTATGCVHLEPIVRQIQHAMSDRSIPDRQRDGEQAFATYVDGVGRRNVELTVGEIRRRSAPLAEREASGRLLILGAVYDVTTGAVEFLGEIPANHSAHRGLPVDRG